MKIAVAFSDHELRIAELRITPSWWDRLLFGARPLERRAWRDDRDVAVWRWDDTGGRIKHRTILDAILAAHRRAAGELVDRLIARLHRA